MNRFIFLLLVNLSFFALYGCESSKSEANLPVFAGSFILAENDNVTYMEISPDSHSGAKQSDKWSFNYVNGDVVASGILNLSEKNTIGAFKVGNDNYTVRWSKKGEANCVLLESKGATIELLQMNLTSEFNNGTFLNQSSTTSFEVNPEESLIYDDQLQSIISFEGRFVLPNSDEYLSGYALASPKENLYYFICPSNNKKYDLQFNPDEHSYTLNIDNKTIKYLHNQNLNHATIHPGTFYFESAIAGKCEIKKVGEERYTIQINFDSEVRKSVKEVIINVHLEGNKVVIDSSNGISKGELSIWMDGETIEIAGTQDDKIYINTVQEDLFGE